jgi:DNA-binding transcriptional LysR family regulator
MDIDLIRTFVAICDTHSFTAAARHVGRTQSAVSLQIRRLEESLGRPLFERGAARVALTEHGRLLLPHARAILQKVNDAQHIFDRGTVEGVVVLGLPEDYAPRILSHVLRGFTELYPAAKLDLVLRTSSSLAKMLADGSVDLAFVTDGEGPVSGGPIAFRDHIVWVTGTTSDAHLRDPLPLAVWGEDGSYARRMYAFLNSESRPYRISVVTRGMTGLRGTVRAGLAVTAMVRSSIAEEMRELGSGDGFPPLDHVAVRLERAHLRKSAVIDRLEAHLLSRLEA